MQFICPLIAVNDIRASREFYENILGLKVTADYGQNVTFEDKFAIHLRSHWSKLIDEAEVALRSRSFELYFEDDTLEDIEQKISAAGCEFVHKIRQQPWHQRVLRFYDPDGHIIEVGESMTSLCQRLSSQGHRADEIASMTGLPIREVERYLQNTIA